MVTGCSNSKLRNIFRLLLTASTLGVVFVALFSCLPGGAQGTGQAHSEEAAPPANVRVAEVSVENVQDRIRLSGEVYATGRVNIMPETNGILTKVLVNPGDQVAVDQIIAYVDPSKPGMSYSENPVRSKTAGTVTAVPAIPGNQVSVQSLIAEVGNLGRLEVEVKVPEKYLASLEPGLRGGVTSRAFPDTEIPARVTEISPVVDPRSRTVSVTLNPDSVDKIRPGQAVTVDLVLDTRLQALTIPASAVTERRDGHGVFVVDGETAAWRPVTVGANRAGMVEAAAGLEAGEMVIISGIEELTHGTALHVLVN